MQVLYSLIILGLSIINHTPENGLKIDVHPLYVSQVLILKYLRH